MSIVPQRYSVREIEFWKKRFDKTQFLTIAEIEERFGLDRSNYSSFQVKIKRNLIKGILDPSLGETQGDVAAIKEQTKELLNLAVETTGIKIDEVPIEELLDLIVRTRAYQVNWERQRQRYLKKE